MNMPIDKAREWPNDGHGPDEGEELVLSVENFTISHSFDTYRGGQKSSHFVSMGFRSNRPMSMPEASALQMEAYDTVYTAVIHDALASGAINTDEANELITNFRIRQNGIKGVLSSKISR